MRLPRFSTLLTPLLLLLAVTPVTSRAACFTMYGRNHVQTTKEVCDDFSYTLRLDVYNGKDLLNLIPLKYDSIKLPCKVGRGMSGTKLLNKTFDAINEATGSDELESINEPYKSFEVCGNAIAAGKEYTLKVSIRPYTDASLQLSGNYIKYYQTQPESLTCDIDLSSTGYFECKHGAP